MSYAATETITVTTDSSGDATAYTTKEFTGVVRLVKYTKTDYEDTADFTVTGDVTGQSIWVQSNVTATASVSPRQATNLNTSGAAALYAAGGTAVLGEIVLVNERIKVVVAQGGNTKTGSFMFVVH